jgi:hypothetical protein
LKIFLVSRCRGAHESPLLTHASCRVVATG